MTKKIVFFKKTLVPGYVVTLETVLINQVRAEEGATLQSKKKEKKDETELGKAHPTGLKSETH